MKAYLLDIVPSLKAFSQKLDDFTLLMNNHWVVLDELVMERKVFIFRPNNELLISIEGKVEKGSWEYLGKNALLIEEKGQRLLFRHGFFTENLLALKLDSTENYIVLINEDTYSSGVNSLEKTEVFLRDKYLLQDSSLSNGKSTNGKSNNSLKAQEETAIKEERPNIKKEPYINNTEAGGSITEVSKSSEGSWVIYLIIGLCLLYALFLYLVYSANT